MIQNDDNIYFSVSEFPNAYTHNSIKKTGNPNIVSSNNSNKTKTK